MSLLAPDGHHHHEPVDHVFLNVGGTRFETYLQVLKKIPATRMSRLTHSLANYDANKNEYFFDRHPGVFSQILNYYRTGKLHYPQCVCGPLFEEELVFWGIDSNQVEPCCWKTYTKHRTTEDTLMTLEKLQLDLVRTVESELIIKFGIDQEPGYPDNLSTFKQLQPMIWQIFEEPRSSLYAKIIGSIQFTMICISVANLWLQSSPMAQQHILKMQYDSLQQAQSVDLLPCFSSNGTIIQEYDSYNSTLCNRLNGTRTTTAMPEQFTDQFTINLLESPVPGWSVLIDYITVLWFIIDFTVRFTVSPDKRLYFSRIDNVIDIVCTLSQVIDIFANLFMTIPNFYMHSIQVIRAFRLFRLLTFHPGLKVIILSVSKSANILNLLLLVLVILSTMFGAFIFFAEKMSTSDPDNNPFISIPDGFWFSLISLTTIGYGDLCPETMIGRLIGAFCVCVGVVMIGLPMTIVVEIFTDYSKHLGARSKMPKERRRICPVEAPRARKKANAHK